MDFIFTGRETDRACNLVFYVLVKKHLDDENSFQAVLFAKSGFRGLGNDTFIGLAVDHDLPFTGTYRRSAFTQGLGRLGAVKVFSIIADLPDRESPFLKQFDRLVNVTAEVIDEVLANNAHQVVTDHLDVVLNRVFADVGVDSGKSLCNSAGTLHGSLVDKGDFHVSRSPFHYLECGTASGHATADDKDIAFVLNNFRIGNGGQFAQRLIR